MMRKPTSGAEPVSVSVVIVTLDSHLSSAVVRAASTLRREMPGLSLRLHAASEFSNDPGARERCLKDIATGDIILATMLFMEEHIQAVLPALQARRESCDAMVACMAAPEVTKLTRMGRLRMGEKSGGALSFLKKLRGKPEAGGGGAGTGAAQMRMLRRLPKLLRFIPGTAQDLRAWFLTLQYWLAGSDDNVANMIRLLVDRYAAGPRESLRGSLKVGEPKEYPEIGLYHPRLPGRLAETDRALPGDARRPRVGVLVMRSYVLAGDTAHYDGVIAALEAKGLRPVPAFASGLDARPAIERFFMADGKATVDAVVSLTGFSLVGGPAYNDSKAAEEALAQLDVPYIATNPVEFQSLEEWEASDRGLMPVETTMMVAIPELDGATGSMVFGGRSARASAGGARDMASHPERAERLASRVARLVSLRETPRDQRRVAIVLFNFPPNAGAVGTAAFLSVFESLFNTLHGLARAGFSVELPESVDALRDAMLVGNAAVHGAPANVHARISAADHVRREPWLAEIEAQWGAAPGRQQTDGAAIQVLGRQFGNVLVGVQPAFGYEGDPMRLLFEKGFTPTHAFSAFYRYLREDFGAHALLHFGTHGALEFMPGKQAGLSGDCWPDRMIADMPNIYLYAANNPSEGALAKRRGAATLVSYLTPPLAQAGLYKGLAELKGSLDHWRKLEPSAMCARADLATVIQMQASSLDLAVAEPCWSMEDADASIHALSGRLLEYEYALIPHGLHVVGEVPSVAARTDLLKAMAEASHGVTLPDALPRAIAAGEGVAAALALPEAPANDNLKPVLDDLQAADRLLTGDHEMEGLVRALDGRFIRPAPGGDVIRTPAVLPTGRNLHGFDPFRMPSAFAMHDGRQQAERLLVRHMADGNGLPESVALVLWGTDNLKTEGGPIAQVLALIGAVPRFDAYGRLAGADLVPLADLGRPRIDVVMTLSGIFRDLLPLQIKLLAEATWLAASADEPIEENFVRKHALAHMAKHGGDLETAALRVFSNADGAYGANVNHLIDNGRWDDGDEIAETYERRKCFAYGRKGLAEKQPALLASLLSHVELAYQNLESVELGVTAVDQYFDTLGGVSRAIARAKGEVAPVYIGDQTRGQGQVRTLTEQVALETRTRMLNPKWYEGLLKHGHEGVRHIEAHVTNTMGWSATTGQVDPWVYQHLTETYMLDPAMRERLAELNSTASARLANRLIEAQARNYWNPDPETLAALQKASEDLEDRLEGVTPGRAA